MDRHMESWLPRHRITVDEYHRMAEVGLLAEDARVELIEGEIIDMAPTGSRHGGTVSELNALMQRASSDRGIVWVQSPVRLSRSSEPRPDLAVLRRRSDFYKSALPAPSDILLIIEVSDTTLRYDRDVKVPLYARHVIPEVWPIDLKGRRVHFFPSPAERGFTPASSTAKPRVTEFARLPGVAGELFRVPPTAN